MTGLPIKEAAFVSRCRGHAEYGDRAAAGRFAAELASLADLREGTGRTYIAEELRGLSRQVFAPNEEDDGQPAG